MAKRIESKRKQLATNINLKADKSKLDAQEREIEKSKLQEELQALQKTEELKILEHQVKYYVIIYVYIYLIIKNV